MSMVVMALYAAQACSGPRTAAELWQSWMKKGYQRFDRPLALAPEFTKDFIEYRMELKTLQDLDTKRQRFRVHATDTFVWRDTRLAFNSSEEGGCVNEWKANYDGKYIDQLWTPGLEYANLDMEMTTVSSALWVLPSGIVWLERQVILTARCSMNFVALPYDTQYCNLQLKTLRYNDQDEVVAGFLGPLYAEAVGTSGNDSSPAPFVYNADRFDGGSAEWSISLVSAAANTFKDAAGWTNSEILLQVHCKRNPHFFESYVLAPVYLLIITSWSSLFVRRDLGSARVSLTLICFLALSGRSMPREARTPHSTEPTDPSRMPLPSSYSRLTCEPGAAQSSRCKRASPLWRRGSGSSTSSPSPRPSSSK